MLVLRLSLTPSLNLNLSFSLGPRLTLNLTRIMKETERAKEKKEKQKKKKQNKNITRRDERKALNSIAAKSLRKGLVDVPCFLFSLASPSTCLEHNLKDAS